MRAGGDVLAATQARVVTKSIARHPPSACRLVARHTFAPSLPCLRMCPHGHVRLTYDGCVSMISACHCRFATSTFSCDGHVFYVEKRCAFLSGAIRNMIRGRHATQSNLLVNNGPHFGCRYRCCYLDPRLRDLCPSQTRRPVSTSSSLSCRRSRWRG